MSKVTKVNEMAQEVFLQAVKEQLSELRNQALAAGVKTEQMDAAFIQIYGESGNFQLSMAIRKAQSAVKNMLRAASAKILKGVIVGSKDRVGKNLPTNYTLLSPDGRHIELANFGSSTKYQGQKFEIPVPALVEIRAEEDPEYGGWNLISIEKYRILDKESLVKILAKIIIPISAINQDFTYKKADEDRGTKRRPARVVVIQGQFSRIVAEPVFHEIEDGSGNTTREVDHYLPVLMSREIKKDEKLPCFGFVVYSKSRGSNGVRCHVRQVRNAKQTLLVTDIESACEDAVSNFKDPEAQAESLTEWYKEMPVIVIGSVDTFKPTAAKDGSGGETNWIDISASCIVDTEGILLEDGGIQQQIGKPTTGSPIMTNTPPVQPPAQKPEETTPPVEKKNTPRKQKPPAEKPPQVSPKEEDADLSFDAAHEADKVLPSPVPAPAKQPAAPAPNPAQVENLAKMITFFCKGAGIKAADVTTEVLKTKAFDMVEDVPDSIVEAAIKRANEIMG